MQSRATDIITGEQKLGHVRVPGNYAFGQGLFQCFDRIPFANSTKSRRSRMSARSCAADRVAARAIPRDQQLTTIPRDQQLTTKDGGATFCVASGCDLDLFGSRRRRLRHRHFEHAFADRCRDGINVDAVRQFQRARERAITAAVSSPGLSPSLPAARAVSPCLTHHPSPQDTDPKLHPMAPSPPAPNWSRSIGTGGRDRSERVVAMRRNGWSRSSECAHWTARWHGLRFLGLKQIR
jgi:hypothetical protein